MKYRLELREPVKSRTLTGHEATVYTPRGTVWAERARISGARGEGEGEIFSSYSATYNIRDVHRVSEGWRVQQLGGLLYTVASVIPNLDRGYVTLNCERVNE